MTQEHRIDRRKRRLKASIDLCVSNAEALLKDAELLHEFERFSTALALAILAQEEFSKAFILQLVLEGALPWASEVRRSMYRHECKHLLAIVMTWLPEFDPDEWNDPTAKPARLYRAHAEFQAGRITRADFLAQVDEIRAVSFPAEVANALNIYRHEQIEMLGKRWPWRDEEWAKGAARKIADGVHDRKKQSACFVTIEATGAVGRHPGLITKAEAEQEIKQAKILAKLRPAFSDGFTLLKGALNEIFANLRSVGT